MLDSNEKSAMETETLVGQISERAGHLFQTRQLMCAEAVVVSLNQGLGGGLTDTQAVAMAAPFCAALGESGCLCGALSGAVMVTGLFLGNNRPYHHRKDMRESARRLHDAFKTSNGATCCRILSRKAKGDKKAHFQQCADLTAEAAKLAARLILEKRPELIEQTDNEYIAKRESTTGSLLKRLFRCIRG